jgi:S-formylglutathione hydrolase FrmB
VVRAAPQLRKLDTYFWFYSGSTDRLRSQNAGFARTLRQLGVPHTYRLVYGGHNWSIWRTNARYAYRAAAERLAHG